MSNILLALRATFSSIRVRNQRYPWAPSLTLRKIPLGKGTQKVVKILCAENT